MRRLIVTEAHHRSARQGGRPMQKIDIAALERAVADG
jgi:hypothetical protein